MVTPLYVKTDNSLLKSMIKISELAKYAKEKGYEALALADENLYGVMEFYKACNAHDLKPIIGLEVTLGSPFVLYAKNEDGYHNLLKIMTAITDHNLNMEVLKEHCDNLICVVPFKSLALKDDLLAIYSDIYFGYTSLDEKAKLSGKTLYFNEVLCISQMDQKYLKYLYGIKDHLLLDEVKFTSKNNFLDSYNMPEFLSDVKNNEALVEACNLKINYQKDLLPVYRAPNGEDSVTYLKYLCKEGLKRIFGERVSKIYIERLKYELDVITKMGFANYFLVVADYVKYAKENGILVGSGRGSAAGSLVAYCLNITTVDPIKYNLLFERFLNPERVTMPDIDIDFEYQRREEVVNYCINKYGLKKVAPIIAFGTLGAKQVLRDVGRVMDIDLKAIDSICRLVDSRISLKENYNSNKRLREYIASNDDFKVLYKIALKFEGLKRHTTIHAAGVVISKKNLDEIIPLDHSHEGFYTTGFSMEYLEELGLLKMDFLALRNLTLINDTIKDIQKENKEFNFDNIPLNDYAALKIFHDVDTIGIFQFESQGMMSFLRKFRPENFEDIVSAIALFRPGPMDNIDEYIKRRKNNVKYDYYHKDLESILKPTYGIIIYQEQIMQIANVLAGYSLAEADILRRAMSKKKESILLHEKEKFINQSVARGYDEKMALNVYNLILKFANYGFNRAHAVSYSLIAYKMAYLKAHYPNYFIKNLFTMVIGSELKTKEYIYEAKLHDIALLKPDINLSERSYISVKDGILFPLTGIKNVGISAVLTILKEREKSPFKDIFDFIKRCYGKSINRKTLEALIDASCFEKFGYNKNTLKQNLDAIINYGEIGELLEDDESLKPVIEEFPEYDQKTLMQKEEEVFGFYLSKHPVSVLMEKYPQAKPLAKIGDYLNSYIWVIVKIDNIKTITTKNATKMGFISGSDELTTIDIVLFPAVFMNYPDLEIGDIVLLNGKVEMRFDKLQLIAQKIEILEK